MAKEGGGRDARKGGGSVFYDYKEIPQVIRTEDAKWQELLKLMGLLWER
jgi:hypothetical protein